MILAYIDTSAALKLAVPEAESTALVAALDGEPNRTLISSWLLHTELYCAAERSPLRVKANRLPAILNSILLNDVTREDMLKAGGLANLRAADAIHLATAIRLRAEQMISYDNELLDAATKFGIAPVSPGL